MTTRAEHVKWCKQRALAYLDAGDLHNAVASMSSDMMKHEETRDAMKAMAMLGMAELMTGNADSVRKYIEGFAE